MDDPETQVLLDKAHQQFNLRRRCAHAQTTLCQHIDPELGWFAAYQCDECGMVTRQKVTGRQLEADVDLPWVDEAMWEQAIDNANRDDNLTRTLAFIGRALR